MPEYLAPGVYVEEIPSGNRPIQAASTSTAGMVGMTARGPVNRPTLVTSRGAYERVFGGKLDPKVFTDHRDMLPYAAEGFFTNGGARLYVVRVIGADAERARTSLVVEDPAGGGTRQLASAANAGDTTVLIAGADPPPPAGTTLLLDDGAQAEPATVAAATPATRPVVAGGITQDFASGTTVTIQTVTDLTAAPAAALTAGATVVALDDVTGIDPDDVLLVKDPAGDELVTVASTDAAANTLTLVEPLRRDHPDDSVLATVTDSTTTTSLSAAVTASPAPVFLHLADASAVDPGTVLRLGAGAARAIVTGVATELPLTGPLGNAHAVGVPLAPVSTHLTVHAHWPGVWGNALRVTVTGASIAETTTGAAIPADATVVTLTSAIGVYPGSVLDFGDDVRAEVAAVDPASRVVTLTAAVGAAQAAGTPVRTQEFTLVVERVENGRAVESERFDRLSVGAAHPRYAPRVVGSWAAGRPSESGESMLVRLSDDAPDSVKLHPFVDGLTRYATGGDDDADGVQNADYIGQSSDDPDERTGLQALENESVLSIVGVPGRTSLDVQQALVAHCEKMRYRFAVLDVPPDSKLEQARKHRQNFDTTRAALYYPYVMVPDLFGAPGDRRAVPPSGHVMGVYARTDLVRGVHKAPANEVLAGVLALRTALAKGEQDILNPLNLNCLRDFRAENRGLRVYGGRVATSDPEWTYVNVRRLLLFIEKSLDDGLQWAVFEPNEKPLWDAVRQSIAGFLDTVWRSGALQGTKQEEAFFVNIGYDVTMTQADIDNGRLIAEVGVAPVKPAEFVIVRISQKTREAIA